MNFTLIKIELKTAAGGKPYLNVHAQPGGWGGIWDPKDIALVNEHGSGPYEGESESVPKGDKTFTNFKNLTLAPKPAPGAETMQPSTGGGSSGTYREPMQIIRTDALRLAQEAIITIVAGLAERSEGTLPAQFETSVLATAQRYARYIEDGTTAPEAPAPVRGGVPPTGVSSVADPVLTLVATWQALKDLVGESKANHAYEQYIGDNRLDITPPDETEQLRITQILLKAAQAAAGRKARLDAAEKPV